MDSEYRSYFDNCIGALDGIHVLAHVLAEEASSYRNRKSALTQNVLAVVTFDVQFYHVLVGWEGSAYDERVMKDAEVRGFRAPEGKKWLANAGNPNSDLYLASYRGTRYHLREQALANLGPDNKEELFDKRHSSSRSVVERPFGVLKQRVWWFDCGWPYTIEIQVQVVYALTVLHNFIRWLESDSGDIFYIVEKEAKQQRAPD